MKRVALTGGSGVLGISLTEQFPDVIWIRFEGDIRSPVEVESWIGEVGQVDAIIHLAALVPTGIVAREPHRAFETNVRGTVNLLEAIRSREWEFPWVFIASSSHVYAPASEPVSEAHPQTPMSLYGLTKLQAEQWGQIYMNDYSIPICIGRIFSYSSRLQRASYFLPSMRERIRATPTGGRLEIIGGAQKRDFMTTRYIIRCIAFLEEARTTGVVNIGSGTGTVLLEAASMLARKMGREDLQITTTPGGGSLVADVSLLREMGWSESVDIAELIDEVASADSSSR